MLSDIGIDYIEGGWPGANPVDTKFFSNPPKMKKTIFKDIPSVNKVLLEVKKNISLHDRYLKFLIYEEIDIIKEEIREISRINNLQRSIE